MSCISIILMALAGFFNACMNVLRFRWDNCIFKDWKNQNWINPVLSWPNKWKPTSKFGDFVMSTMLVWVTDFWHLLKFLMLLSISLSIVFYTPIINWWIDWIFYFLAFTVIFEISFSKILIKN